MLNALRQFLRLESASGLLLMAAAVLAMLVANSPLAGLYEALLGTYAEIRVGGAALSKPLLLWINDGLMAVFFLLIGLEIKREAVDGELSAPGSRTLPVLAAIGGIVVPALVYLAINHDDPVAARGWAIPAATDIAFALGVMSLLGRRVPTALKALLLSVAIIDDLGAILIIAVFYTAKLSLLSLGLALLALAGMVALNRGGVRTVAPYVLLGIFAWVCVLNSGVHATLAGVAMAFTIPMSTGTSGSSPAARLEHSLHPWVAFGILPVFAFANAGVSLEGLGLSSLLEPVPLGIALGLIVGKQVGVFGFSLVGVKLGLAALPRGVSWSHLYGLAMLTGIGFTMSLFIGSLAFEQGGPDYAVADRLGILSGSLVSAVAGYLFLRFTPAAGAAHRVD